MADKIIRKILTGQVVKISSKNTIRVRVETKQTHPLYGKVIKSHKNYLVHIADENAVQPNDTVRIGVTRPLSKLKSWEYLDTVTKK